MELNPLAVSPTAATPVKRHQSDSLFNELERVIGSLMLTKPFVAFPAKVGAAARLLFGCRQVPDVALTDYYDSKLSD
jgi:hypothetical protein